MKKVKIPFTMLPESQLGLSRLTKLTQDAEARQAAEEQQRIAEGWRFLNTHFGVTPEALRQLGLSLTPAILELELRDKLSDRSETAHLLVLRNASGELSLVDQAEALGKPLLAPDMKLEALPIGDGADFLLTCPEKVFKGRQIRIFRGEPSGQGYTTFSGAEDNYDPPMRMKAAVHGITGVSDLKEVGDPARLESTFTRILTPPKPLAAS